MLYKALLVDDEELIREPMKLGIDWTSCGVGMVYCAENGETAWQLFQKYRPEIILTDIKMPICDGITLLKRVHEFDSKAKVIVLTGYDEFKYAQSAVKFGAFDYLLKASDIDEVTQVVSNATKALDEQIKLTDDAEKKSENVYYSLEFKSDNDFVNFMHDVNLHESAQSYAVFALTLENYLFLQRSCTKLELENKYYSIVKLTKSILSEDFELSSFRCNNTIVCIVSYSNNKTNVQSAKQIADCLYREINKNESCLMTYSSFVEFKDLRKVLVKTFDAVEYVNFAKKPIYYKDTLNLSNVLDNSYGDLHEKIITCLRRGDDDLKNALNLYFENIEKSEIIHINHYYQFCFDLFSSLMIVLNECALKYTDVFEDDFFIWSELKLLTGAKSIKDFVFNVFLNVQTHIKNSRISANGKIVKQVEQYISDNYHLPITLHDLANLVHLNSNYLSFLFKQQRNKCIIEHITDVRMQKAKQLLELGEHRVNLVGEMVGYDDSGYFCKVFKKYTGVTPNNYKKNA